MVPLFNRCLNKKFHQETFSECCESLFVTIMREALQVVLDNQLSKIISFILSVVIYYRRKNYSNGIYGGSENLSLGNID